MSRTTGRQVLFATMPYSGHVGPLLPIARTLTERGHRVRWCTGREFAERIAATGAEFAPMDAGIDPRGRAIEEVHPERAALRGLARLRFDMSRIFLDPIPAQLADLRALLAERPADVLVHDSAHVGAADLSCTPPPR